MGRRCKKEFGLRQLRYLTSGLVCSLFSLLNSCTNDVTPVDKGMPSENKEVEKVADSIFGFSKKDVEIYFDTIQEGWTLSHMLLPHNVSQFQVNLSDVKMKDSTVGLNYVVAGKPYAVVYVLGDTSKIARYVVYEPDVYSYVTFDYSTDSVVVTKTKKAVHVQERIISGEIIKNSNLSVEINKQVDTYALTAALADGIESIYAWSIDFFKLQEGDKFIVVYEEKTIDGVAHGVGDIKHTWFEHSGSGKYAFLYTTDSSANMKGYYDEQAREMKRPFLMSPVKFARMTSAYNLNRIHPIYKQKRAHLGTDYAAPTGTPILATADGTVIKASRSGGNGIYVKLRHNSVYETQYLHMSKHGEGIREGVRVRQGQVIGYVGSTGAATGPHVCYRFWKNGKQVDHRAEKFPNSEPMKKELIPDYLKYIETPKKKLDDLISNFN